MRAKLQRGLDELRDLMKAKTSADTRRSEVEKSKAQELADLRRQVSKLHLELSEARKTGLEGQNKLKVEVEHLTREYNSLKETHSVLVDRERSVQDSLAKVTHSLSDLEKAKRSFDSELYSLRTRQNDSESQLADALRANEVNSSPWRQSRQLTNGTRAWSISLPMRKLGAKTLRIPLCNSSETSLRMTVSWRHYDNNWMPNLPSVSNWNN
jgi:predicted  nucleic acid-binding Zn-ribbon protein